MERPFAITLPVGSSLANTTGSWRSERPVYVERRPPCQAACPAAEQPRSWLAAAEDGSYEEAWRRIVEDNPLPAVTGRICFHPCQTACLRGGVDEAVGIHAVERFLGDEAIRRGWELPGAGRSTGLRVLVVGSGPAGLSAAYQLRRQGHRVDLLEAAAAPGGLLRSGIPRFRLPRAVVDAEIERLLALGVELHSGERVTDLAATMRAAHADAAFVAVGAQLAANATIPAGDSARILNALDLLAGAAGDTAPPRLGRRVVVVGGGDTAMDAARTARRLGAADAVVVYRRTRERMPAHDEEVRQAEEEGIALRWLSTVAEVDAGTVQVERMELDADGFPQPTGEVEELGADAVVLAVGETADLSLFGSLPDVGLARGLVQVDGDQQTGHPGVFAGGDLVAGEHTATAAIGQGAAAARAIGMWLAGREAVAGPPPDPATAERLEPWYYADAPASVEPRLAPARRATTFDEVVGTLDEDTALFEARRCLSCGSCFECDNCYGVCPDNAVRKLGPGLGYRIDLDYCKGCGICARECPCGAIDMVPEEL